MHSPDFLFLISGTATRWLQMFAALSILILLHEFGHYFFAKLFKTRVEKFYLFFDFLFPLAGVLNFSLFKKKIGDTVYGIGWFPLGGYVKIAGMVDDSMDKEQLARPPEPWEFRSKPAWQRLFIMLGGIIVNVLVAMIVYMFVFGVYGEDYLPNNRVTNGIAVDSIGKSIGLMNGDRIVSIDNKPVERFDKIRKTIFFDGSKTIQVDRQGQSVNVPIPQGTLRALLKSKTGLITMRVPVIVSEVVKKTAADSMQLKTGDSIIAINNFPVRFYDEFDSAKRSLKGQNVRITVVRNGGQIALLSGRIPDNGALGFVQGADPKRYVRFEHISYSFFGAVGRGTEYTFETLGDYWKQFKMIFTSKEVKVNESVGGLGTFSHLFGEEYDFEEFLRTLAFVSIILAFMNLLPVPGLDGGYVLFLLIEMVTRRKVPDRVLEIANTVGLVLLLGLMLYANGLDIFRSFFK